MGRAAGAVGDLWDGGTLFEAGGGLHCQSDPEATEVGLRPLEAGIDEDAGRRRQVWRHLHEVLSPVRGCSMGRCCRWRCEDWKLEKGRLETSHQFYGRRWSVTLRPI